jgi:aminoglycoside 6'-N-acetyltransferase
VVTDPVSFAPLARSDLVLLARWLAEPLVARWWNHELSTDAIERDFGPAVDRADATELFVVARNEVPVGLIQRYPIAAYPEWHTELAGVCPVPPCALSIDYLLGEPAARNQGFAPIMIGAFVTRSWADHPAARDIIVPVAAGNIASWRTLARAGFRRIARGELEPDNPIDPRDHVVYQISR